MKGFTIGLGGIVVILLMSSFLVIYITGGYEPIHRNIVSVEGEMISFVNKANLLVKTFNASIEFISQRAAYDLGKIGGLKGSGMAIWDDGSPTLDVLKQQLENKIKENLPKDIIEDGTTIDWEDAYINASDYDTTCGPIESSECFLAKGNKSFSIYDESIDSRISVDHKINSIASSNYFKLIYAGRKMLTNTTYTAAWPDIVQIQTLLSAEWPDMKIDAQPLGDYSKVSLWEECLANNDFYCVAPTRPGEPTIIHPLTGKEIQYDYIRLTFKDLRPLDPSCSDGIDNEGDGYCDLPTSVCTDGSIPGDPGCSITGKEICMYSCDILLGVVLDYYGVKCGSLFYNHTADVNKDKNVSMFDAVLVGSNCNDDTWCANRLSDDTIPCECGDTINNDGDSNTDFPDDLGCAHKYDDSECGLKDDSCAVDQCCTGLDCVSGNCIMDNKPPTYSFDKDNSGGSVIGGTLVKVSTLWKDNVDLDNADFLHNESGVWILTTKSLTGSSDWANLTIDTTGHEGKTICWYQKAVDKAGNVNASMNSNTHCFYVQPLTCVDGTAYGDCSATKPKYCDSGTLTDRCDLCGCPSGYSCQLDGTCSFCGNNIIETGEQCDKTNLGGEDCMSLGFDGGTLGCSATCTFNTSNCQKCGNNVKEGTEECDNVDFGGITCAELGYVGGTLNCEADCTFDTSGCGYSLIVNTRIDVFDSPLSNVEVNVDGDIKYSDTSGIAEFILTLGGHTISVEPQHGSRKFTHFWDQDCDNVNIGWWLDTNSNPFAFTMYNRNREITAWYKVFTKITDLSYNFPTISGKLLDESDNALISSGEKRPSCEDPTSPATPIPVDRDIILEYYDGSWNTIGSVTSYADGSWSYTWTCDPSFSKIRASYYSSNWYYNSTSAEISINCCIDPDGSDKTVKETCTDKFGLHTDYCIDTTHICEYVCNGACSCMPSEACPPGMQCCISDGICSYLCPL